MKIICGTDFSEHAEQASRAAAALARRLGDTLVLAHVWDETLGEGLWQDFHDRMSAAVRNRLYDHAVRLRKTGASVEEEMLSGMPDVELAKLASRLDARLLVVGSLGRRSSEWLLGSVAEHVAVRAPVPTLVVRSAVPFEAWARGERPLKIFVAFDFTGTAEAALRWIKGLAAAGPCEVVVGYVDWPVGEAGRLGITGQFLLSHNPPQVQRILERELSERVGALLGEGVARIRVEPSLGRADVAAGRDGARGAVGPRCRRYPPAARLGPRRASVNFARLAARRADERRLHSRRTRGDDRAPERATPPGACRERPLRARQPRDPLCIRRGISRWRRAVAPRPRAVAPDGDTDRSRSLPKPRSACVRRCRRTPPRAVSRLRSP